jgi:hypothetical protein
MAFNSVSRIDDADTSPQRHHLRSDQSGLAEPGEGFAGICVRGYALFHGRNHTGTLPGYSGRRGEKRPRVHGSVQGQPEMQGGLVKTLDWKIYSRPPFRTLRRTARGGPANGLGALRLRHGGRGIFTPS